MKQQQKVMKRGINTRRLKREGMSKNEGNGEERARAHKNEQNEIARRRELAYQ